MTTPKDKSQGTYMVEQFEQGVILPRVYFRVVGPTATGLHSTLTKYVADRHCALLNAAYAAGQAAMSTQADKIREALGGARKLIHQARGVARNGATVLAAEASIDQALAALSELEAQPAQAGWMDLAMPPKTEDCIIQIPQPAQAPSASVEQRVQDVVVSIELFNGKWHAQFTIGNQTFKLRPLRMDPLNGSGKKDAQWQADMLRKAFGGSPLTSLLDKR